MLKTISYEYVDKEEDLTNERCEDIKSLFEKYDGKLFKWDNDERIFFKEENEETIKEILKATNFKSETMERFIEWFDDGRYLKLTGRIEISIGECIKEVKKIINNEDVTNRLINSEDISKELDKIIKEQMLKVLKNECDQALQTINNSNFEWR